MSNNKEVNCVQISGNLGQAPEYRPNLGQGGRATFSLAHSRYVPALDGETNFIKRTYWFRCVCWGKLATTASRLPKGAHIKVTGRLESREWEDAKGQPQGSVEIIVEQIEQVLAQVQDQLETNPPKADKKAAGQAQNVKANSLLERLHCSLPRQRHNCMVAAGKTRWKDLTITHLCPDGMVHLRYCFRASAPAG